MSGLAFGRVEKLSLRVRYYLDEAVTNIQVSAVNEIVFGTSAAGQIVSVNGADPEFIWQKLLHLGPILSLAELAPYPLVASGGEDGVLIVVDRDTGEEIRRRSFRRADGRISWISHLAWSQRQALLAMSCGKEVFRLSAHLEDEESLIIQPTSVSSIAWNRRGDELAVSCFGGASRFLARSDSPIDVCRENEAVMALAWSPQDSLLACGCHDSSLIIWNIKTGDNLKMSGYPGKVLHFSWDTIGRFLLTAGKNALIIWDFIGDGPSGKPPIVREYHDSEIVAIAVHPKGRYVCTGSEDGSIVAWRTGDFQPIGIGKGGSSVTSLRWAKNGRGILSGHIDGGLICWDLIR